MISTIVNVVCIDHASSAIKNNRIMATKIDINDVKIRKTVK